MLSRLAAAAGVVLLAALCIVRISQPPSPVPATAPDTVFSAERALRRVSEIAQRPHALGMPDHDRVRDYLVAQLRALGLTPQVQATTAIGTRYPSAGRIENILARVPGSSGGRNAVLIVAHYDGVEAGPAASDDGAGAAAILETVRALRARKTPLRHDVIVLLTDGEESGLLGAAAFVREHPWAKDVAFALNFEARGTTGRSTMFETGPGDLDAVRMLRAAGDVSAGSLFTTVYKALPNDTDLSELSILGAPALNFAFAAGVERYHTTRDDSAHLNPGSLQHHGQQMLRVATRVANDSLPRPTTADAVFFDLPLIGLVIYPYWMAMALALVAIALVVLVVMHEPRSVTVGAAMLLLIAILSVPALLFYRPTGHAMWSGLFAAVIVLATAGLNLTVYFWFRARTQHPEYGAYVVWALAAVLLAFSAPGLSYVFTWPVLFAAAAAGVRRRGGPGTAAVVLEWLAIAMTMFVVGSLAYGVPVVMLGVAGPGAAVLVMFVSLMTWLIAPTLEHIFATVSVARATLATAAALLLILARVSAVKYTADHPDRSVLVYAERDSADSSRPNAWLGALTPSDAWSAHAVGRLRADDWTLATNEGRRILYGQPAPSIKLGAPVATLVSDSTAGARRRVTFRVTVPAGTTVLLVGAMGQRVLRSAIDGREVHTLRMRSRSRDWGTEYWNVPDSGAVFTLDIPAGGALRLDLSARRPGLPPSIRIPERPDYIVPSQTGDYSVVYRRVEF